MLRIKAIGPCTISGFHTLRSGEICDVPAERQEQVERLRKVGRVELVEVPAPVAAAAVLAEPLGNEAQAAADASSPAPAALTDEEREIAELEAELAKLESKPAPPAPPAPPAEPAPQQPKRPLFRCVCGKTAPEHVSGKTPVDGSICGGLKKNMVRAPAPAVP